MSSNNQKPFFIFAHWRYCPTTATLVDITKTDEKPITLRAKLNLTLKQLVDANGQVVTKQQLIEQLWQGNELTGNKGLVDTISALRKTLGQYQNKNIIKTHPKLGYSLDCTIAEHQTEVLRDIVKNPSIWFKPLTILSAVLLSLIGLSMVWLFNDNRDEQQQLTLTKLLTNQSGMKRWPTITSDSELLAYVGYFDNPMGDLFLQNTQGEISKLSDGKTMIVSPKWSPDGTLLAYLQQGSTDECEVKVYDRRLRISHSLTRCRFSGFGGLSWSSDSRRIYFNGLNDNQATYQSLDIEQDKIKTLMTLEDGELEISYAQWLYQDQLIYIKAKSHMDNQLLHYDSNTGQTRLLKSFGPIVGFSIHPNKQQVTVAHAISESDFAILDINLTTLHTQQINIDGLFLDLTYLANGDLMLSKYQSKQGIISIDIANGKQRKLISSVGWNRFPVYSEAKQALTFQSNRNGQVDIWQYDPVSQYISQITDNQVGEFFHSWSPDGSKMAFVGTKFNQRSILDLYLFDTQDKQTTRLHQDKIESLAPVWHPNGRDVVILKPSQQNTNSVHSIDIRSGESVEITGLQHPESVQYSNNELFYFNSSTGFITLFDESGDDIQLAEKMQTLDWANWLVNQDQVIYVQRGENDLIKSWDRTSKQVSTIATLPSGTIFFSRSLAFNQQAGLLYICVNQSEDGNIGIYQKSAQTQLHSQ